MADRIKSYFFAPDLDCIPGGRLVLGGILTDPLAKAHYPLNYDSTVPVTSRIETNEITDWEREAVSQRGGHAGIYAQFLSVFGIGGDLDASFDRSKSYKYKFERLVTESFKPSKEYIEQSMQNREVLDHIKRKTFDKDVYMITSIKTAYRAEVKTNEEKNHGLDLNFSASLAGVGPPVDVGPKFGSSSGDKVDTGFANALNFVFAYRLRKIRWSIWHKAYNFDDYTSAASFGLSKRKNANEIEPGKDMPIQIQIMGIEEEDEEAEAFDIDPLSAVDDDGDLCDCVIPPKGTDSQP